MKQNPVACHPERIELFLRQQLTDQEQTEFESHLDDCGQCRRQLEATAARDDIWRGLDWLRDGPPLPNGPPRLNGRRTTPDAAPDSVAESGAGEASYSQQTVLQLLGPTDDDRMIGRLGTYEVVGVVGAGGMGVVLKALDAALNRYVAIKVLAPHLGNSGAARKRFSREAKTAAAVVHDNVIEIHCVADVDGLPYLVMPYVRGPSLQRRLDHEGPLTVAEILRIGVQAAAGLAAAHAQGLVHRDVKPANILLADGVERVKLTDFGLARAADDASLTRTGIIAGTPQYMSPEQARGESVDQRSDLFSLGSVLYAMCTGRAPFRAETSYGVLRRVTDDEPRAIREINPDIPLWLCQIIARLMSKRPEDRFQSADEVGRLLQECLAHVQQPTAVPLPRSLAPQSPGRRLASLSRRWLGAAVMIAALGLSWLGFAAWQASDPPDIAGKWTGEPWGAVRLEAEQPGEYQGTFAGSGDGEAGKLRVKWSRVERRFNGTWAEGEARGGKLSLRLVGEQIRGAWTTDKETQNTPGTPRLADLMWTRAAAEPAAAAPPAAPPASTAPQPAPALPQRLRHFAGPAGGNDVKVACSADGRLIALASGNPTRIMQREGTSRVKGEWRPSVDVLDSKTGETVASLELTSAVEDAVVAVTPRVSHVEATALAFSPVEDVVAVGTSIGQVKLFNARTGELVRSLDDAQAKLADEETPDHWKSLRRAMGNVASLAFSPDGKLLATCGGSFADFAERFDGMRRLGRRATGPGRLKLWDVQTGKLKHDLVGHDNHANAVAFSPDGRWLASAGRWLKNGDSGNGVLLWNPRTGTQIHRLIRNNANGGTRAIAFSPDSKLLAIGTQRFGDDDASTGGVSLVRAASGVTQWLVTVPGWAKPVALLRDGSVAVLCGGKSIRLLDPATGATRHEIRRADSRQNVRWSDLAIAQQSGLLAIGEVDDKRNSGVQLWSIGGEHAHEPAAAAQEKTDESQPIQRFTTESSVATVALSADGKLVAITSNGTTVAEGDGTSELPDHRPTAEILVAKTGGTMASLQVMTEEEGAVLAATAQVPHVDIRALALSHDGTMAAVGTGIGQVKLFNAQTGALIRSLDDEQAKLADDKTPDNWKSLRRAMGSVESLAFSPDGSRLAVCGGSFADFARVFDGAERSAEPAAGPGRLQLWDVQNGTLQHDLAGHSRAHAVAFSQDGNLLASAGRWNGNGHPSSGAKIWNSRTGQLLRSIQTAASGDAQSVMFSTDSKLLLIGTRNDDENDRTSEYASNGDVVLVQAPSGKTKWRRTFPGMTRPVLFSTDGTIVVLHQRRMLSFLDGETGRTMMRLRAESDDTGVRWNDIATAKQGHMLAIGGVNSERRGTVQVWDFGDP